MSAPDERWWDVRAGEYVLGTLDAKGRELFVRILRHDPALQRSVRAWQAKLAPLDATAPPVAPPERVWTAIERVLRTGEREGAEASTGTTPPAVSRRRPDDDDRSGAGPVRQPPPGGLLAPSVAAFATAASLILGLLLYQERERATAFEGAILQADGVSVILGEDGAPLWLVQADFEGERVRVTALTPPPVDGAGDYQLWQVLPDGGGVAAVSLLPESDGESRDTPVPGLVRTFDAFAVSLEPDGGSPEPAPTGTVLYQGGVVYTDEENGS